MSIWTQADAIELCRKVEAVAPEFGCHVALTGGLLYKDGPRKDADLLFYRHRQSPEINVEGLWKALKVLGFVERGDELTLFVQKATYDGKPVDVFFPEAKGSYGADGTEGAPDNPFRILDGATQDPLVSVFDFAPGACGLSTEEAAKL